MEEMGEKREKRGREERERERGAGMQWRRKTISEPNGLASRIEEEDQKHEQEEGLFKANAGN